MDHLRISGTGLSSVILSQTSSKIWKAVPKKVPKPTKANRDGVIKLNPQKYNFNQFNTENVDALKHYESTEVDRKIGLHVPSGTLWSTSSNTNQVVEI